jgi:VWFA-related protein
MLSGSICPERRGTAAAAAAAAIGCLAVGGAWGAAPEAAPETGLLRSGTELGVLQVSVIDQAGRYVPGLQMEDFAIREEGVRQATTVFSTSAAPLDTMLLLDTSGSMHERMDAARRAARDFVGAQRPGDRAALVTFNERVRIAQALTGDVNALTSAIDEAPAAGGTALYEAIYIALRELARERRDAADIRRQALIVLTDGDDTSSRGIGRDEALAEAQRSAVTIFTILPASEPPRAGAAPPERNAGAEFSLRTLAEHTGGRAFLPSRADDLGGTYMHIAEELSHQYWLGYVPASSPSGGFRRVSVRVLTDPTLRARTRTGYSAAARPTRPSSGPSGRLP